MLDEVGFILKDLHVFVPFDDKVSQSGDRFDLRHRVICSATQSFGDQIVVIYDWNKFQLLENLKVDGPF